MTFCKTYRKHCKTNKPHILLLVYAILRPTPFISMHWGLHIFRRLLTEVACETNVSLLLGLWLNVTEIADPEIDPEIVKPCNQHTPPNQSERTDMSKITKSMKQTGSGGWGLGDAVGSEPETESHIVWVEAPPRLAFYIHTQGGMGNHEGVIEGGLPFPPQ